MASTPPVKPAIDPRAIAKNAVNGGATSGKSGAVAPAAPSAVDANVRTAQASTASSKTGTATKTTALPPQKGAADLSAGDLTSILNVAGETQSQISDAYKAGASAQQAIDATAANTSSTASTASTGATGSTGLLSLLTGNWKVLVLLAGTVGAGYYLYRRNKNGMPLFNSAPSEQTMEGE